MPGVIPDDIQIDLNAHEMTISTGVKPFGESIELSWVPIKKSSTPGCVQPHLLDYARTCASFTWDKIRRELDGLPGSRGLNIAHEAVDRHANGPRRDQPAIRWLGRDGTVLDLTYADLKTQTNRFANVLAALGVDRGDGVFTLTGKIPELYVAAIGAWKQVAVFCPLFSAFGPEPIYQRLRRGGAKVLVTTKRLYWQKVAKLRERLPQLTHVLLTDTKKDLSDSVRSLPQCMAQASGKFVIPPTDPEEMAILHFTSGTTGMPKGAVHVHNAVLTHYMTGKVVLDFHPEDVFWCTADPGWVTGTSYGIIAPLVHGITNIIEENDFDAQGWYRILEKEKVTIWYTAPTAIRRMMCLGIEPRKHYDLRHLRLIHSVGEPLNPEAVVWGQQALGLPIHDNWWQTETGGIMIANFPVIEIRPGSMGLAVPGIDAAIVRRVTPKTVEVVKAPGVQGELALKPGWPSMFRGYIHDEARYMG
jgi:acetyl-CoA synthetase